jgi:hypothetical protein
MGPPFFIYPPGLEKIVTYMKERYNNIPMIVTENGAEIVIDYSFLPFCEHSVPFCETNVMIFRLL